eukprot:TRINITY_DN58382_c0_g1_i1.p1 TRINITY_DN58382_c0_g1~~TRINITY_DN58382_c0_g1_i1.p1  ORF type:complete len:616 (+),score=34.37 TRINITY_DN58382_c0_g1_i1:45-1850(+)
MSALLTDEIVLRRFPPHVFRRACDQLHRQRQLNTGCQQNASFAPVCKPVTITHVAVIRNDIENLEYLLTELHADPHHLPPSPSLRTAQESGTPLSPYELACMINHKAAELIEDNCAGPSRPSPVPTLLRHAASGNLDALKAALLGNTNDKGKQPMEMDVSPRTHPLDVINRQTELNYLECAAANGHTKIIEYALANYKQMVAPNHKAMYGGKRSALSWAVLHDHLSIVKCITTTRVPGLTHEQTRHFDYGLLFDCCTGGSLTVFKYLLQKFYAIDCERLTRGNTCDERRNSLLHRAALFGKLEICEYLLEHGADPGCQNAVLRTPIISCMEAGHIPILKLLYEKYNRSEVSWEIAILFGVVEVTEWLLSEPRTESLLKDALRNLWRPAHMHAVERGALDILKLLVKACQQLDMEIPKKPNSYTMLHVAAQFGHVEVMDWLLNSKISNISETTGEGADPFATAAAYNQLGTTMYLLEKGYFTADDATKLIQTKSQSVKAEILLELLRRSWISWQSIPQKTMDIHKHTSAGNRLCLYVATLQEPCTMDLFAQFPTMFKQVVQVLLFVGWIPSDLVVHAIMGFVPSDCCPREVLPSPEQKQVSG